MPDSSAAVPLAQADADGPKVDSILLAPGRSAYIRSTGITGGGAGSLYLVNDSGVVFGVRDAETGNVLGLPDTAVAAPWPVLALLPRGPELSKEGASVTRDSVATAPFG